MLPHVATERPLHMRMMMAFGRYLRRVQGVGFYPSRSGSGRPSSSRSLMYSVLHVIRPTYYSCLLYSEDAGGMRCIIENTKSKTSRNSVIRRSGTPESSKSSGILTKDASALSRPGLKCYSTLAQHSGQFLVLAILFQEFIPT